MTLIVNKDQNDSKHLKGWHLINETFRITETIANQENDHLYVLQNNKGEAKTSLYYVY